MAGPGAALAQAIWASTPLRESIVRRRERGAGGRDVETPREGDAPKREWDWGERPPRCRGSTQGHGATDRSFGVIRNTLYIHHVMEASGSQITICILADRSCAMINMKAPGRRTAIPTVAATRASSGGGQSYAWRGGAVSGCRAGVVPAPVRWGGVTGPGADRGGRQVWGRHGGARPGGRIGRMTR